MKATLPFLFLGLGMIFFPRFLFAAAFYPPWTEPPEGAVRFTVPGITSIADLHGDPHDPDLVIFFGGNQFMVLPELMAAFQAEYPAYQKIYYQTLPPGILEWQIEEGSLVVGNLKITIPPDIFVAGVQRLKDMDRQRQAFVEIRPYFRNRLAIMVREGNPLQIHSLSDLARPEVKVSMPDPETEGIARKAMEAFRKAGGEELVGTIMDEKLKAGSTFITQIHHRQTPMRIMAGESDAGPVWYTEARFQQTIGNPIGMVEIPDEHNIVATTAAGMFKDAPHGQAARDFLDFITSDQGQSIYRKYCFMPLE